jgi:rhomboid family GlyGly-CTERM serine protease
MPDAAISELAFRMGPDASPDLPQRPASRRPLFTGGLLALLAGLFALFPGPESLAFNADAVAGGEVWRLVTGHFVHADLEHLAWNGLALAVLGWLIEREERTLLLVALSAGVLSVSALLLSPLATLSQYCGLSGVLNSLLVVTLFVEWRRGAGLPVLLVGAGSVAKLIWELSHGSSLLTQIDWPPYPAAHAAGMLGGILMLLLSPATRKWRSPRREQRHHARSAIMM